MDLSAQGAALLLKHVLCAGACSSAGLGDAGSGVTDIEGVLQSSHFSSSFAQLQELYGFFMQSSAL